MQQKEISKLFLSIQGQDIEIPLGGKGGVLTPSSANTLIITTENDDGITKTYEYYLPDEVGEAGSPDAVKYTEQNLNDAQRQQAKKNVGLNNLTTTSTGQSLVLEGKYKGVANTATAPGSTALGGGVIAKSDAAHAEGLLTTAGRTTQEKLLSQDSAAISAISEAYDEINFHGGKISGTSEELALRLAGFGAHAEGISNEALGSGSHAEGSNNTAVANSSHAEGDSTIARGQVSHAEGYNTEANGNQSHAEGADTIAGNYEAHAEGKGTQASGKHSHSEGYYTEAKGVASHAEGYETIAEYDYSHASGLGTKTINNSQTVVGQYNKTSKTVPNGSELFTVGSGASSNRANAFNVYKNNNQSYGLISHGMYVNSVNSNNLLQTAASVYSKIDSKLEPVYDEINTKLDNYKRVVVENGSSIDPFKEVIFHIDSNFANYEEEDVYGSIIMDGTAQINLGFYGGLQSGDNKLNLAEMYQNDWGSYPPNPCTLSWELYSDYGNEIIVTVFQMDDQKITTNDIALYPEKKTQEKIYIDFNELANGPIPITKEMIENGLFIEGEIEGELYLEPIQIRDGISDSDYLTGSLTITNANKTTSILPDSLPIDNDNLQFSTNYFGQIPSLTGPGNQLSEIKYYYYKTVDTKYTKSITVTLEIEWEDESLGTSKFALMGLE